MTSPVRASQARLVSCYVRATQLEAQWIDSSAPNRVWSYVRDVQALLADTAAVLTDLVRERDTKEFPSAADTTLQRPASASDPVGDMAFVACVHLRHKIEENRTYAETSSIATLVEAASSGIRRVIKTTSAVEPVFAASYGLVPRLNSRKYLDRALGVRRAYTTFRVAITTDETQGDSEIARARAALHELIRSPCFRDVRWPDRSSLLALGQRLDQAWQLGQPNDDARRLVSDVVAFAQMLANIGQREELIEYDLQMLPVVIQQLDELIAAGRPVLRGHLECIRGLDDLVEGLLAPGRPLDGKLLRQHLVRAWGERSRGAGLAGEQVA